MIGATSPASAGGDIQVGIQVWAATTPVDMRKSFDGLAAIVSEELGQNPLSGHLFVFTSKRRDRVKLLYFERGGYAIWYKRLEEGTFALPQPSSDGKSVQLSAEELGLILSGIDLASVRRRKRYERQPA
jgi:transposase